MGVISVGPSRFIAVSSRNGPRAPTTRHRETIRQTLPLKKGPTNTAICRRRTSDVALLPIQPGIFLLARTLEELYFLLSFLSLLAHTRSTRFSAVHYISVNQLTFAKRDTPLSVCNGEWYRYLTPRVRMKSHPSRLIRED